MLKTVAEWKTRRAGMAMVKMATRVVSLHLLKLKVLRQVQLNSVPEGRLG